MASVFHSSNSGSRAVWMHALLCAVLMVQSAPNLAQEGAYTGSPPRGPSEEQLTPFFDPSQTVEIDDGRRIQLVCMGEGSPTVLLTTGLGALALIWSALQSKLAEHTQVCSWSRAGYGLSSSSKIVQTADNRTSDLEAAIAARGLEGPFILVGASLGAYESVLFADRHGDKLAGLVLADPSIPNQAARRDRVAPAFGMIVQRNNHAQTEAMLRCAMGLRRGEIGEGKPDPEGCLRSRIPPGAPEILRRTFANDTADADSRETQASLQNSVDLDGVIVVNSGRNYGDVPLIVLSAGEMEIISPQASEAVVRQYPLFYEEYHRGIAEYANLSTNGIHRVVEDASHDMGATRPDGRNAARCGFQCGDRGIELSR